MLLLRVFHFAKIMYANSIVQRRNSKVLGRYNDVEISFAFALREYLYTQPVHAIAIVFLYWLLSMSYIHWILERPISFAVCKS